MANNFYNKQIPTIKQPTTGKGVLPQKGQPQKSELNMSGPNWPGLPGKTQRERNRGIPEEKIYASAQGIRGGSDGDGSLTKGGKGPDKKIRF